MKLIIVLFLLTLTNSFTAQQPYHEHQDQKNLPSYIGRGYHLLQGNPFANKIDPGYRASIFELTYDQGRKTDDAKYRIPDNTNSAISTSCSLQTTCNQYSGTENYQKTLNNTIKFDTKFSYEFIKAAFTFSDSFQKISEETISYKKTAVQSNAECYAYTIELPFYKPLNFDSNFIQGIQSATTTNNWEDFINHFGTHYAAKVAFGGRYILEHTYEEKSMSFFESLNLDVKKAAQVQFFNYLGIPLSDQAKKYSKQTQTIDTKIDKVTNYMVGGEPPKSGEWIDWQRTVKDYLAPVSVDLISISALFSYVPDIDAGKAQQGFESYVNSYCLRNFCPPVEPERPEPKPLQISFHQINQIGGSERSRYNFNTFDNQIKVGMRVFKIKMGIKGSIDSIQFFLTDGLIQHDLSAAGQVSFNTQYNVPKNDEIKCIQFGITYNGPYWKFTSMQFITKGGIRSEEYKGELGINTYRSLCISGQDDHFVGFFGHYGSTFDSIGFNLMKQSYAE